MSDRCSIRRGWERADIDRVGIARRFKPPVRWNGGPSVCELGPFLIQMSATLGILIPQGE